MNWINFFLTSLIAIGGFIAATYEVIARRMRLPVGNYFKKNGIMIILGGFAAFAAIIYSAFINPWWSVFLVFIAGWFFCQILVSIFKISSQVLSLALIVAGITLLFLRL